MKKYKFQMWNNILTSSEACRGNRFTVALSITPRKEYNALSRTPCITN